MAKKETETKDAKKTNKKNVSGDVSSDSEIPVTEESIAAANRMPVMIHAQYLKDISFENPNAPHILMPGLGKPDIDINFSMDAHKLDLGDAEKNQGLDNLYEVSLGVHIKSTRGDKTAFIAEIEYGMSVSLNGVPENRHHPVLLIEIPKFMFPYVRQIATELTAQGGYPPLVLAPVNFSKFYMDKFGQNAEDAA